MHILPGEMPDLRNEESLTRIKQEGDVEVSLKTTHTVEQASSTGPYTKTVPYPEAATVLPYLAEATTGNITISNYKKDETGEKIAQIDARENPPKVSQDVYPLAMQSDAFRRGVIPEIENHPDPRLKLEFTGKEVDTINEAHESVKQLAHEYLQLGVEDLSQTENELITAQQELAANAANANYDLPGQVSKITALREKASQIRNAKPELLATMKQAYFHLTGKEPIAEESKFEEWIRLMADQQSQEPFKQEKKEQEINNETTNAHIAMELDEQLEQYAKATNAVYGRNVPFQVATTIQSYLGLPITESQCAEYFRTGEKGIICFEKLFVLPPEVGNGHIVNLPPQEVVNLINQSVEWQKNGSTQDRVLYQRAIDLPQLIMAGPSNLKGMHFRLREFLFENLEKNRKDSLKDLQYMMWVKLLASSRDPKQKELGYKMFEAYKAFNDRNPVGHVQLSEVKPENVQMELAKKEELLKTAEQIKVGMNLTEGVQHKIRINSGTDTESDEVSDIIRIVANSGALNQLLEKNMKLALSTPLFSQTGFNRLETHFEIARLVRDVLGTNTSFFENLLADTEHVAFSLSILKYLVLQNQLGTGKPISEDLRIKLQNLDSRISEFSKRPE